MVKCDDLWRLATGYKDCPRLCVTILVLVLISESTQNKLLTTHLQGIRGSLANHKRSTLKALRMAMRLIFGFPNGNMMLWSQT